MNRVGDSLFCTGANQEVIEALVRNGVEFLVVGGLAVSWHCPSREADDMDLLVNPTQDNSERIAKALHSLRLSGINKDSFTRLGIQAPLKHIHYAELLTPRENGPTYSEVAADAVEAKLFNIVVRVASVSSLIRLKEHAAASLDAEREKHIRDIELLRKHGV